MNKKDIDLIGFEIIASSGEARSLFIRALKKIKSGVPVDEVRDLLSEADKILIEAHNSQTKLLTLEASGDNIEIGFISVHAQDHLMTTLLLKDTLEFFLDIYK